MNDVATSSPSLCLEREMDEFTCQDHIMGISGFSYFLVLAAILWSIDKSQRSSTSWLLYIGTAVVSVIHLLFVSLVLAGCMTSNRSAYKVSKVIAFLKQAIWESLVIWRFRIFASMIPIRQGMLVSLVVAYWATCIIGSIAISN